MPSPYASVGVVGGIIALGILLWNIWNHTPEPSHGHSSGPTFNPGPGYDRPTNDDWRSEDNEGDNQRSRSRRRGRAECVICTESLASATLRQLPCQHVFHDNCISLWFRQSRTCPQCRSPA